MIDAHLHYLGDHPETMTVMASHDLKMLNITVSMTGRPWRELEANPYRDMAKKWPERFAWCTSFELPTTGRHDSVYANRVIDALERDIADGAIACKVWKNFGMELKDEHGQHILIDAAVLTPVFEYLAQKGVTVLSHIAEPMECWLPINPDSAHHGYYSQNPQWHMYGRTDIPSHGELMTARDRVLERHPYLRMVGAHLGSLEYDLNEIALRFEKYPNFAVDNSARLLDMVMHDRDDLREFMVKYAGRILYGTDMVECEHHSRLTSEQRKKRCEKFHSQYLTELAYFSTSDHVKLANGKTYLGLALPEKVLNQFLSGNAKIWYPGM